MVTYTILGATGNCGTALLTQLLQAKDVQIKAYCRNKAKLERLVPEVIDNSRVEIFTGSITDVALIAKAMHGSQAVFLVASTNDNIPGCSISQDLVRTVISALEQSRSESDDSTKKKAWKAPKLLLLSSATIDPWLSRKTPFFNAILWRSAWHVYRDLELAEEFLRKHEDWAPCIYIKPGGLSVDVSRGHRLTLDDEESFLSYLDLAGGMIEAAGEKEEGKWEKKNVGVVNCNAKGETAKFPMGTPKCILLGLARYYFPWLHGWLPANAGPA